MSQLTNISDYTTADTFYFCKDHPVGVILWTCVFIITFVFGFPGTIVVLLDMFQKRRKGTLFTPNDVFTFNLTVMDGLYFFCLLLAMLLYLSGDTRVGNTINDFFFSFNICGRPLFVTCISLDCYLAVVHPVIYRARKSLTPRIQMAAGVWIVTVSYGLLSVTIKSEVLSGTMPAFFCSLVLPIVGFCDICTVWTLSKSSRGGRNLHPQKKKALLIIIDNLVITFISYIPPLIVLLISRHTIMDSITFSCIVVIPVMSISLIGTTISVILFLILRGKLGCLKCCKQK